MEIARSPVLAALCLASCVSTAAAAPGVTVLPDKILLGHDQEFVPRFATYLPRVLVVPAGTTITLPPDSTWDAIEVGGTLRVARDRDTIVRFTHLMILPGGVLDAGTTDDPISSSVRFIVRDVPIDTGRDPFQFGNGIINFGRQTRVGRATTSFVELTGDAAAGATEIRLTVPGDWRVGDALLLPDLRQITPKTPVRRESRVVIAAIGSDAVVLSKPLDFEHLSISDPTGTVRIRPRVANLTRNIVVASENPLGTRGHTIEIGDTASWDIRYNVLADLGRTRNIALDSTTVDEAGTVTHLGANQVGRYASHNHHAHGHGCSFVGNVLHGTGVTKWGHVVHGTHDTLVEANIALDFPGAGFVTEDGYEVRNVFRRNVAAFSSGNGVSARANAHPGAGFNCPGCEGSGFWFHGLAQTIVENEGWNNFIGMNLFAMFQVLGHSVPGHHGGPPDTSFDPRKAAPATAADNVALSNTDTGHELWGTPRFPFERPVTAHNGQAQVRAGQSGLDVWLKDVTIVAGGGVSLGVSSSAAYVGSLEVDGGRIAGCRQAFMSGGARKFVRLRNLTLQCVININFSILDHAFESIYENVVHVQYGSFPKRYFVLGPSAIWQPGMKLPALGWDTWMPARGSRHIVKNWQGTGVDYRLYTNQQRASVPAWPADGSYGTQYYCPEAGITMGECWERYGVAFGGGVIRDEEAIELEGLINGVAQGGAAATLGTPRATLTTPNLMAPATIRPGRTPTIRMLLVLTGNPDLATDAAIVQIDNRKPVRYARPSGQRQGEASFESTAVDPGTHTVRTWREDRNKVKIPGSELVFHYTVPDDASQSAGQ